MVEVKVTQLRKHLKGYPAIGKALGMSARMARYHASRTDDPLPVYALDGGGRIAAFLDELKAWNDRRLKPRVSSSVAA